MSNITNSAEYRRRYYRKRKEEVFALLGGKCSNCGSTSNLEIDHIDPTSKKFCVSKKLMHMSRSRISLELSKCQLLCHECHLKKSKRDIAVKMSGSRNPNYKKTGYLCQFSKPVIDLDTNEMFSSGSEYAKCHGLPVSATERVCRGDSYSIHGFRPRYV